MKFVLLVIDAKFFHLPVYDALKKYCLESMSGGISYMKEVNGRLTGLVTFCVDTAFYNRLLKER